MQLNYLYLVSLYDFSDCSNRMDDDECATKAANGECETDADVMDGCFKACTGCVQNEGKLHVHLIQIMINSSFDIHCLRHSICLYSLKFIHQGVFQRRSK